MSDGGESQPMPSADLLSHWFRGVVQSDESALESLFRATYDGLFEYARRIIGDEDGAGDVVQEAFIRLWGRRDEHDPSGSVRGLLFRTVRNLALNVQRDERRRRELLEEKYEPPRRGAESPDEVLEATDLRHLLGQWMDELPDRQREALHLSRFEGLSHEEIATVMEVSARTVNNHLVRGLRTLRDRARTHGVGLDPGGARS